MPANIATYVSSIQTANSTPIHATILPSYQNTNHTAIWPTFLPSFFTTYLDSNFFSIPPTIIATINASYNTTLERALGTTKL